MTAAAAVYRRERLVKSRQVLLSLYLLLFLGLGITGAYLFMDARAEYNRLEQVRTANRRRLEEAEQRLQSQEKVLERLRNDPAFVDKVIRRKLGYAKPDEFIFRFED
jgi:cell division protein FtsB